MAITFRRLQEYLDLIALQGGNIASAPHGKFWATHVSLTQQPIPAPKCNGQDIFPVKYLDSAHTRVDADNSPLYVILTNSNGFCEQSQMPPLGPWITESDYQITLADGSTVTGDQIKQDIYDWLTAGALNDD
jgi:hypothetical protein